MTLATRHMSLLQVLRDTGLLIHIDRGLWSLKNP